MQSGTANVRCLTRRPTILLLSEQVEMGKKNFPFEGRWHIVSVDTWDEDYFNEEVQAFIEFEEKGGGSCRPGQGKAEDKRGPGKPRPPKPITREHLSVADGSVLGTPNLVRTT